MTPRKGNKNAVKYGVYADHFTAGDRAKLASMPSDEIGMELVAQRWIAAQALEVYQQAADPLLKLRALDIATDALQGAITIVLKNKLLAGEASAFQGLWDAIEEANRLEGWDDSI